MIEPARYGRPAAALFVVVPAVVGAALGWGLLALLDWLLGLPWVPIPGSLSLLDRVPDQIALPLLIGLGLVAGALFCGHALRGEVSLTVADDGVRLKRGDAAGAPALLRLRARALAERRAADPGDLRAELGPLGVVVLDEGGHQYWRHKGRPDAVGP